MKIYSVNDKEFAPYGKVLNGYNTKELLNEMKKIPLPDGVAYETSIKALEDCKIFTAFKNNAYGGMPIQLGLCWGHNSKLNCLEYHRDSEINIGLYDFILLLAKEDDIVNGVLDTAKVKAFKAPAGVPVEVYATSLHYAPCHTNPGEGFSVAIVLPFGTNTAKPEISAISNEDKMLFACNKWLIAHKDTSEAQAGAYVGLVGENIDISKDL